MIASFRNGTRFTTMFLALVAAVAVAGLTDAQGGTRRIMKKLDPAAAESIQRLDQRVSFELNNASISDLISAVSNKLGVPILQSPAAATSAVQNARFTLKADNVPAEAVLMEALAPFELRAVPSESGITIDAGKVRRIMVHAPDLVEEDVIVSSGEPGEARRVIKVRERKQADGQVEENVDERVFVKRINKEEAHSFDAGGKMKRELTIKLDENGVRSEGKLTMEITK